MKNLFLTLFAVLSFFQVDIVSATESTDPSRSLKYGIRDKKPYCFKQENGKYSGLDLAIFDLLSLEAGLAPSSFASSAMSWAENLDAIKNGTVDVIGNATKTADREAWGIFSIPYRDEEHVIVTSKNRSVSFSDADGFIAYVKEKNLKVGVLKGATYNSSKINNFLKGSAPQGVTFAPSDSYEDLIKSLMENSVDVAIMESVNVLYLLNEQNASNDYTITRIGASAPQHFLFSKKTVKPELVEIVNKSIRGSLDKIRKMTEEYTAKTPTANLLFPEGAPPSKR